MGALVATTHAFRCRRAVFKSWVVGTSPTMTGSGIAPRRPSPRHGRPCGDHLRLRWPKGSVQDVDGRDEPDHDGEGNRATTSLPASWSPLWRPPTPFRGNDWVRQLRRKAWVLGTSPSMTGWGRNRPGHDGREKGSYPRRPRFSPAPFGLCSVRGPISFSVGFFGFATRVTGLASPPPQLCGPISASVGLRARLGRLALAP